MEPTREKWERKAYSFQYIDRFCYSMWLFHLHGAVENTTFFPVFPLGGIHGQGIFPVIPLEFQGKSINHFL